MQDNFQHTIRASSYINFPFLNQKKKKIFKNALLTTATPGVGSLQIEKKINQRTIMIILL